MKKTVIITGATSGIGLEATRFLAGKGYCIFAVGHSTAIVKKPTGISGSAYLMPIFLGSLGT